MNIEQDRKNVIENLPDNFNQLFEMIKLNNKLINAMDKKIKLLEAKAKK